MVRKKGGEGMKRQLRTLSVARELVSEFRKTGDLARLVQEVSNFSWHFGRYCGYNRKLFIDFLVKEIGEVMA